MARRNGFYWIRTSTSVWMVGFWDRGCWYVPGSMGVLHPERIEVNETQLLPPPPPETPFAEREPGFRGFLKWWFDHDG